MKMTFDQYISNPMGVKSAVISNREMYRELYTNKLDKILVREIGVVDYKLYYDKQNYYIHFKIPSEIIEAFYYDTVIMFYPIDKSLIPSTSLKKYGVKFFSNDPSFMFTFAHAFLKNDLFIKDLVPRMSKQAVKKAAIEKNPKNQVGYVKSIYFAYLLTTRYRLFDKFQYKTYGKKYNKLVLLKNIEHSEIKYEDRQKAGVELTKKKKKEKEKSISQENKRTTDIPDKASKVAKTASRAKVVRKTKRI